MNIFSHTKSGFSSSELTFNNKIKYIITFQIQTLIYHGFQQTSLRLFT